MPAINSLGIGSGVLTADVIDQLKENERDLTIVPIESKITTANAKTDALDLLENLFSTFKTSVSALKNDGLYLERQVSGNNSGIEVIAEAGVAVQDFTLSVTQLAQKDIQQSGSFSSTSDLVASGAVGTETMDITIDGTTYNIEYDNTTTLSQLSDTINEIAGTKVSSSILQTGTNTFSLVLASKETGANQAITTATTGALDAKLLSSGTLTQAQGAQDAIFDYNGIELTRESNEITDITFGITINLLQDGASSNIKITQDPEPIVDEMNLFVSSYNTLVSQLKSMTIAEDANGQSGLFSSDSTVKGITRELSRAVLEVTGEGNSLVEYGIDIDRFGVMSLDETTFNSKLADDPSGLEEFFSGKYVDGEFEQGVFGDIYDTINNYTKYSGQLDNIQAGVKTEIDNLSDRHEQLLASLDNRYAIMTKRFIAYDQVINRLNAQGNVLQTQIDALSNNNN